MEQCHQRWGMAVAVDVVLDHLAEVVVILEGWA